MRRLQWLRRTILRFNKVELYKTLRKLPSKRIKTDGKWFALLQDFWLQEYNTKDARRRFDEVIGKVKDQAQQKTNEERKDTHEDYVEKLVESAEYGGKESHGTNKRTP